MRTKTTLASLAALLLTAGTTYAQETTEPPPSTPTPTTAPAIPATPLPPKTFPAIGGHLGFAVPIATIAKDSTVIGQDFVTAGLTPGLTVHLDEKWAVDFEFIAFNEMKNTPATTTYIVDPGIIRKFDGFVAGLRVATQVGAPTNVALVPIFVLPIKISEKLVYFFEGDLPMFLRDGGSHAVPSLTFLFQSGFGF